MIEIDLVQACDVGAIAERVAQKPEQRHLAFERAKPLGIEAELVNAVLRKLALRTEPDFTKSPFAKLAIEHPTWAPGNFQAGGGTPAEGQFLAGHDGAASLGRIRRLAQRRYPLSANFKHIQRLISAGEKIRAMRHPSQPRALGPIAAGMFADVHAGDVECAARQKDLPSVGQRHHAGSQIDGQPHDLVVAALQRFDFAHFAEMNPGAHLDRGGSPFFVRDRVLQLQGKTHRVRCGGESQQKSITGILENLRALDAGNDRSHDPIVLRENRGGGAVAEPGLQLHELHDISEGQDRQLWAWRRLAHKAL